MALQIETLLALQELDTEIGRLRRELGRLDTGAELQKRYEAFRNHCVKLETSLRSARAALEDAELELKSVEQKKKDFEKRLYDGKVTNPKELTAIEREIEMLGRHRGTIDERVLTNMDTIEATEKDLAKYAAARDKTEAAWRAQDAAYKSATARLEAEIAALTPRRQQRAAELEAAALRRYEDLRTRLANLAIARIQDANCGACHMNLARQVIHRVQAGTAYVYCENCGRFLAPEA